MKCRVLAELVFRRYGIYLIAGLFALIGLLWIRRSVRQEKIAWRTVSAFGIRLPTRYALHGIDVSKHNARIDWTRVQQTNADGIRLQFAFIKATEGATMSDKQFERNWREAGKTDLRRGAYHFYHPTRDPLKQANNFIRNVTLLPGDFAPVVDFEVTNGQSEATIVDGLRQWLETVEDHYDARPIIYTNRNLYRRYIRENFTEYPLWIADYSAENLQQYDHEKLYLWQHSQAGVVKGIRGKVDFNVFVLDEDRLDEICL